MADIWYVAHVVVLCNALTPFASASLKVAEVDLDAARNHIQQLSRSSKQALASLNATHDEYESTTEAQLTASWVCSLRSVSIFMSIHMSVGITRSPTEHSEERRTANRNSNKSTRVEWQADMRTLGDAIVDMSAAEKNLTEDRISRESDVRVQVHPWHARILFLC